MEKLLLGFIVLFFCILVILAFVAVQVGIFACLVMLICNVILPLFDVQFPVTIMQGCGIGIVLLVFRLFIINTINSDRFA